MSIQDLRPGPNDDSTFSPPRYAIWVNSLWISSLAISITSALLATLLQQWTRRYTRVTQPPGCPHKRARVRQFFFKGVGYWHFLLALDAVPTLLHLSVFLFFAGLLVLLRHISHTVFNAVVVWVLFCVVIYACIIFLPYFVPTSPHYAPLSSLIWQLYTGVLYPFFKYLTARWKGIQVDVRHPVERLVDRLQGKAEEYVSKRSAEFDSGILELLLVTLGEDGVQEQFFEAIPGFYDSKVVQVQDVNAYLNKSRISFFTKFRRSVDQFLNETLSSDSISESVRSRRLLTCLNATHRVLGVGDSAGTNIIDRIIRDRNWNEMPPSPEVGDILIRWRNSTDPSISRTGSCIIARIIASVEKHDDTWMALARSQLGVTEKALENYLVHGDSVLLANLIQTTRLFSEKGLQFQDILRSISGFNVKDTLPELQHSFCALWDEVVQKSKSSSDCIFILAETRHVYDALHPTATSVAPLSTNNDSLRIGSYPFCADPQSHNPPDVLPQISPVVTSSSSSLRDHPLLPPPQRDETNNTPHLVLDTPSSLDLPSPLPNRWFPVEVVHSHIPPALRFSDSTTTSHTLATPRDASVSDPQAGVIVVAAERDVQDLNGLDVHHPHQFDAPADDISVSASRPAKSLF